MNEDLPAQNIDGGSVESYMDLIDEKPSVPEDEQTNNMFPVTETQCKASIVHESLKTVNEVEETITCENEKGLIEMPSEIHRKQVETSDKTSSLLVDQSVAFVKELSRSILHYKEIEECLNATCKGKLNEVQDTCMYEKQETEFDMPVDVQKQNKTVNKNSIHIENQSVTFTEQISQNTSDDEGIEELSYAECKKGNDTLTYENEVVEIENLLDILRKQDEITENSVHIKDNSVTFANGISQNIPDDKGTGDCLNAAYEKTNKKVKETLTCEKVTVETEMPLEILQKGSDTCNENCVNFDDSVIIVEEINHNISRSTGIEEYIFVEDSFEENFNDAPSQRLPVNDLHHKDSVKLDTEYYDDERDDLTDERWNKMKQISTDEEWYREVKYIWKNKTTPNPNKNLTSHNFRKRHFKHLPLRTLSQVKRPNNEFHNSNQPKRLRTCTYILDEKMNEIQREKYLKENEYEMEMQQKIKDSEMNFRMSRENIFNYQINSNVWDDSLSMYYDSICSRLWSQHQNNVREINDKYRYLTSQCNEKYSIELSRLNSVKQEVLHFNKFYQNEGDAENDSVLTDEQLREVEEIDNIYNQFSQFYGNNI